MVNDKPPNPDLPDLPTPRQGVLIQISGIQARQFHPIGDNLLAVSVDEDETTGLWSPSAEFFGFKTQQGYAAILGAVCANVWYLEPLPVPESFLHDELEDGPLLMMLGAPMYLVFEKRLEPAEVLAYVEACSVT